MTARPVILVLRALGLGDLATAVPALRGLRTAYPEATLALAAPDWLAPLVELIGGVDLLVPTDGLDPSRSRISLTRPYRAVNLHGRGPQSHRLLRDVQPAALWAFGCPAAAHDGPRWRTEEHEVHRWCRLLAWYGVRADPADLDLRYPGPGRAPAGVSVLHPGGKGTARRWLPQRFAALAAQLTAAGHRVVITGTSAERELARGVAVRAGLPDDAVLAGRMDLVELAALVAQARVVVSTDTGVAHLATAYRTPSVVLFGPVHPRHWGPPADRPWHRALWSAGWEPGVPEGDSAAVESGIHPSLAAITVAQVRAAVDEVDGVGRMDDAVTAQ